MKRDDLMTRKMLSVIREGVINDSEKKLMTEEAEVKSEDKPSGKSFPITKKTPQFSDVRISQEESLIKTIGESVELEENALVYYPDDENGNLVLVGKIGALNLVFMFKYKDKSGDGCYMWANKLQLTDTNNRTIGKVRDAFTNWKNSLIQNGDLLSKLHKAATR